jgi:hypothetical protein
MKNWASQHRIFMSLNRFHPSVTLMELGEDERVRPALPLQGHPLDHPLSFPSFTIGLFEVASADDCRGTGAQCATRYIIHKKKAMVTDDMGQLAHYMGSLEGVGDETNTDIGIWQRPSSRYVGIRQCGYNLTGQHLVTCKWFQLEMLPLIYHL